MAHLHTVICKWRLQRAGPTICKSWRHAPHLHAPNATRTLHAAHWNAITIKSFSCKFYMGHFEVAIAEQRAVDVDSSNNIAVLFLFTRCTSLAYGASFAFAWQISSHAGRFDTKKDAQKMKLISFALTCTRSNLVSWTQLLIFVFINNKCVYYLLLFFRGLFPGHKPKRKKTLSLLALNSSARIRTITNTRQQQ